MKLPKDSEERKKVASAVASLLRLPPAKRRQIVDNEMRKRGLQPNQMHSPPPSR